MPYMNNLSEYHERKKDGTPTDTPHPHGKIGLQNPITGFKRKSRKEKALILGLAGVVGINTAGRAILRKRFAEIADALNKFNSSES